MVVTVIWDPGANSPAPGPFSFELFLVVCRHIHAGGISWPSFDFAALPANIFRSVALCFWHQFYDRSRIHDSPPLYVDTVQRVLACGR